MKRFFIILLILAVVICLIGCKSDQSPVDAERAYCLTFIDAGQGDCAMLRTPTGKIALVDCGTQIDSDLLIAKLLSMGVKRVDALFFSHIHDDHVGGAMAVLDNFDVTTVYMGNYELEGFLGEKLADAAGKRIEKLSVGESVTLDSARFDVLYPDNATENGGNNDSLVLLLTIGQKRVIFTGDIEADGEKKLVEMYHDGLRADILKVAHHGSDYSSGDTFLDAVLPQCAVISCGEFNSFGHPGTKLLDRLYSRDIRVWRTDICGSVEFVTDGERLYAMTESVDRMGQTKSAKS